MEAGPSTQGQRVDGVAFPGEREDAIGRVLACFEGVDADVNLEMAGANPPISGRQDDSVTAPAVPSVTME